MNYTTIYIYHIHFLFNISTQYTLHCLLSLFIFLKITIIQFSWLVIPWPNIFTGHIQYVLYVWWGNILQYQHRYVTVSCSTTITAMTLSGQHLCIETAFFSLIRYRRQVWLTPCYAGGLTPTYRQTGIYCMCLQNLVGNTHTNCQPLLFTKQLT